MPALKDRIEVSAVVQAIKSCLPKDRVSFPLHEPYFEGNEWNYVKECLDTKWVSSAGTYVDLFEKKLQDSTGIKKAVAVVNGTAALHTALGLAGVKQGDEVLVPTLTFVAAANAVSYCGAIPHLVDSDETTLGVDPHKLEDWLKEISSVRYGASFNKQNGRKIKALIAVHTFGHPVDLDAIQTVCEKFHIELIEDAAESLGSYYKGRHTGHWGKISILSFNGNKTVTTGGGGAILTNDEALGKTAKHITTTAKIPHLWEVAHNVVGYNYRLPNLNAALGCAQLEQLPAFLARKRELAKRYQMAFSKINGVRFFTEPEFAKSNYWLNTLILEPGHKDQRDELLEATHREGIMTRPVWTLMHRLPMYADSLRMNLSTAENLSERVINIPSGVGLSPSIQG